jgi:hypothetical protein
MIISSKDGGEPLDSGGDVGDVGEGGLERLVGVGQCRGRAPTSAGGRVVAGRCFVRDITHSDDQDDVADMRGAPRRIRGL